jgi:hypothetical protein
MFIFPDQKSYMICLKKKTILRLIPVLLFIISTHTGCKKNGTGTGENITPPDLTTQVSSSVSGFVVNENNLPVLNATVQVGSSTVSTDKYGFFEVRDVRVIKNAATATVNKTGYFKSIKTYTATEGKSVFFRIKLIPKTNSGTISSSSGGSVTLSNGMSISFPASSVVNAATNAVYNGTVNVAAYWINPASNEISSIMPGDLRGLNTDGNLQLLATYGMAAVELTGAGGELLQIAAGKKASLSMPIPSSLLSSAPSAIPLWYFDETKGLWKQEGSAAKTGSNYVGDVNHFSFWNCDVPGNYVRFDCTLVNATGQPIPYAYVKVTALNPGIYFSDYGYTDSTGYVSGYVPPNAQLKLEVFDNSNCGNAVYTQLFNTGNTNISLGNIVIVAASRMATLEGIVKNCNNTPVTNGYIIITDGNILNRHRLSSNGTYSVNKLVCSFPNIISLIGEDVSTSQQSTALTYVITNAGINNIPGINACGLTTQEYFNYTDNGVPYTYSTPVDTTYMYAVYAPTYTNTIYGRTLPLVPNNYATITFGIFNISVGSNTAVSSFSTFTSNSYLFNSGMVNITEYGNIGQFEAGTFNVTKTDLQTQTLHTFTGSFRIRRTN